MTPIKPPKKTGTIEIRLPDEAKAAFMAQCRAQDRSASEAIRAFIDEQLSPPPLVRPRRTAYWRIAVAGMIGAALGVGAAAPSLARAAQSSHATFEQLDRNHDGLLSYDEFRRH